VNIRHAVDREGRVYCAKQQKAIDVLECYDCKRLVTIDLDSREPKVTCELERDDERRPS
jgi:hypothetical protein